MELLNLGHADLFWVFERGALQTEDILGAQVHGAGTGLADSSGSIRSRMRGGTRFFFVGVLG